MTELRPPLPPPLVDTHCHLDYIQRAENHPQGAEGTAPQQVLARAKQAGVQWLVNPCVHPRHFRAVISLAEQFESVYAAVAVHPTDVNTLATEAPDWQQQVEAVVDHPKVIAIGETGLDYYRDTSHAEAQQDCFRYFLNLARSKDLPVIIHDREAHADVIRIVDEFPGVRGIMHCFSGDADLAFAMVERGFYISFAGNVTFKNAHNLHAAAKVVPLDRLLIETDAPFLSPVPFRGKPNEPARVAHVAEKIADLREIPLTALAEQTYANACRAFNLPQRSIA